MRNENTVVKRIERAARSGKTTRCLGIGDDAALWTPTKGYETILTCDWFLEGTHFLRDKHPAGVVGWKCLARAVSDIAAMGGEPACFLLSLAVPSSLTGNWLDELLRGLRRASRTFHCELAGGDTTQWDRVLISITVIGEARKGRAVLRSGARPGDILFVSGTLGEAEFGLRQLRKQRGFARARIVAERKHLYPEPRLALGKWLATKRLATAMMDLSDGLSTDLPRLCMASSVGARIYASSLPVCPLAKAQESTTLALHGGDDYELLFAVSPSKLRRLPASFRGVRLTRIGEVTQEKKLVLVENGSAHPLPSGGWDPFREG